MTEEKKKQMTLGEIYQKIKLYSREMDQIKDDLNYSNSEDEKKKLKFAYNILVLSYNELLDVKHRVSGNRSILPTVQKDVIINNNKLYMQANANLLGIRPDIVKKMEFFETLTPIEVTKHIKIHFSEFGEEYPFFTEIKPL